MESLTIVIPTFNRQDKLKKALEAHLNQSARSSIRELIVVDDGSTDNTRKIVSEIAGIAPFAVRYFRQEKKGPAAARNLGIREAQGGLVLFTDDDIIPTVDLVQQHLSSHGQRTEPHLAVLGYVTWAPEVQATPFMDWYESDGMLFGYDHLQTGVEPDYRYFYTCNISLKTEFLRKTGLFDEEFRDAAFEDVEYGYRLQKAGMRISYNRNAVSYHYQFVSFEDACLRARKAAVARQVFFRKEAGQSWIRPPQLRPAIRQALMSPLKPLMDMHIHLPWRIYRMMYRAYCDWG